jgi:hypothetical protein
MAIDERKMMREALEASKLELDQMHSHYQPKCNGGCPTLAALALVNAALNLKHVTVIGRRYFDRSGNTYHSVTCIFDDGTELNIPYEYGYGDCYRQTAHELISQHYGESIVPKDAYSWMWYEQNGFVIDYQVTDVTRKKDL